MNSSNQKLSINSIFHFLIYYSYKLTRNKKHKKTEGRYSRSLKFAYRLQLPAKSLTKTFTIFVPSPGLASSKSAPEIVQEIGVDEG